MWYLISNSVLYGFFAWPAIMIPVLLLTNVFKSKETFIEDVLGRVLFYSGLIALIGSFGYVWKESRKEVTPSQYVVYKKYKAESFDVYQRANLDTKTLQNTFQRIEADKIVTNGEMGEVSHLYSTVYSLDAKLKNKEKEAEDRILANQIKAEFKKTPPIEISSY